MKRIDAAMESVAAIYECVLNDPRGDELLERLRTEFAADVGVLFVHDTRDTRGSMTAVAGVDAGDMASYAELSEDNLRMHAVAKHGRQGDVLTGAEVVDDRQYKKTAFYNEWLRPRGLLPDVGVIIARSPDLVGAMVLGRNRRAAPYSTAERHRLGSLAPYLLRAVALRQRLGSGIDSRDSLMGALRALPCGVAAVAVDGRVVYSNDALEKLLAPREALRWERSRLRAAHPEDDVILQKLIRDAIASALQVEGAAGGSMQIRPSLAGGSLRVEVSPLNLGWLDAWSGKPVALILVQALRTSTDEVLRERYELTAAECRVARGLASGLSLGEIAARHHLSKHTIRAQLRAVFQKLGVRRQAELVRLVMSLT